MKSSAQIIGLPIISISDGVQIGIVKTLVINPEKGSIDFLIIEHEDWQINVKAIPFKKVVGIGEFALTIESGNAVIDLTEIPIANQLVSKKIEIKNTRIMTRIGELLGDVNEYYVNDDTGLVIGMKIIIDNGEKVLSSKYVLTYGKDMIIVNEEASNHYLEQAEDLDSNRSNNNQNNRFDEVIEKPKENVIEEILPDSKKDDIEDLIVKSQKDDIEDLIQESEPLNHNSADDISETINDSVGDTVQETITDIEDNVEEKDEKLDDLKRKQIDVLNGKTLIRTIYDSKGQILFKEGTTLTSDDILKAQEDGPQTVVKLSMNVEE